MAVYGTPPDRFVNVGTDQDPGQTQMGRLGPTTVNARAILEATLTAGTLHQIVRWRRKVEILVEDTEAQGLDASADREVLQNLDDQLDAMAAGDGVRLNELNEHLARRVVDLLEQTGRELEEADDYRPTKTDFGTTGPN